MQMKHLIIFALVGMVALLGFNLINDNQREKNRAVVMNEPSSTTAASDKSDAVNGSTDIANQPLGKQPKAILDNATTKIDQAQQADQQRLDKMSDTQQ